MIQLRLRGPRGLSAISLTQNATLEDLRSEIITKTGLSIFDLKHGFPPERIDLDEMPSELTLQELKETGLDLNKKQLIASERPGSNARESVLNKEIPSTIGTSNLGPSLRSQRERSRGTNNAVDDPPEVSLPTHGEILVLRVMPDDNSCMFRALSSAVLTDSLDGMTELRSIVASTIQADSVTYSAAILDKQPEQYCRWIQTESSWGGGIELGILSQYFGIEICSVNVQDGRVDRFNEGAVRRCILVYSGIHYDVVALVSSSAMGPSNDTKIFESNDDAILVAAVKLCEQLRKRHYYTDTGRFTIKCGQCGWQGAGEQSAIKHAKETGHYDFGEASHQS